MTEVTEDENPSVAETGPKQGAALPPSRLVLIGASAVVVGALAAGIITSTLLSRKHGFNKPGQRLLATAAFDKRHRGATALYGDAELAALESSLRGDGSELITPLDRGYRLPVPTQNARALASK